MLKMRRLGLPVGALLLAILLFTPYVDRYTAPVKGAKANYYVRIAFRWWLPREPLGTVLWKSAPAGGAPTKEFAIEPGVVWEIVAPVGLLLFSVMWYLRRRRSEGASEGREPAP